MSICVLYVVSSGAQDEKVPCQNRTRGKVAKSTNETLFDKADSIRKADSECLRERTREK